MERGTQIECTACNGTHKGLVVAVIVPNVLYGVAWADRNVSFGRNGNTDPQYPAHFVKAHGGKDVTTTPAASIRAAK